MFALADSPVEFLLLIVEYATLVKLIVAYLQRIQCEAHTPELVER